MATKTTKLSVKYVSGDESTTKSYNVTASSFSSDTAISAVSGIKTQTTASIDSVKLTDTYDLGGVE